MRKKLWSKLAGSVIEDIEINREEAALGDKLFFEDINKGNKKQVQVEEESVTTDVVFSRFEHDKIKNLSIQKRTTSQTNAPVKDLWENDDLHCIVKPKKVTIHPGMSYRPSTKDHDSLMEIVAEQELLKDYMYSKPKEAVLIPKEVTIETPIAPKDNSLKTRKIKRDKNKELMLKYEALRRQSKSVHKRISHQLDNLPALLKNMKSSRLPIYKTKYKTIKDNSKIGRFKVNDPTPVQLKEDVPSSLRQLPSETSSIKNMYMMLLKSNKIEFSKFRLHRNKKKTKEIVKSTHKL